MVHMFENLCSKIRSILWKRVDQTNQTQTIFRSNGFFYVSGWDV